MPIAMHGVMLYAHTYTWIDRVKLYAQCYTRGKVYAHCHTWSEVLRSILYMD